jgi:hypothetical protein
VKICCFLKKGGGSPSSPELLRRHKICFDNRIPVLMVSGLIAYLQRFDISLTKNYPCSLKI